MKAVIVFIAIFALAACSTFNFPGVHRINIQQGNVITQAMIDRLKPGMTKSQVKFVLGNPVIDDPLDRDRWDYLYSMKVGGGKRIQKKLVVHFVDDRLSYFEGDYLPSSEQPEDENEKKQQQTADKDNQPSDLASTDSN